MTATETRPDAIADREELSTADACTETVSDQDWEAAVLGVVKIAGEGGVRGERGRRAVHDLCGHPFVERPLWTVCEAMTWILVTAVLSGNTDLRARANALIKSVLALAAEAQRSLGKVA